MKFIYIIIALTITACSVADQSKYEVCPELTDNSYVPESYFPLETGNLWNYKITYSEDHLKSLSKKEKEELQKEYTMEIGDPIIIYQKTSLGRQELNAFKVITNSQPNYYHYYVQCENGVSFVEVDDFENLEVVTGFNINNFISESSSKWEGISQARIDWIKKSGRATRGSTLECETVEQYIERGGFLKKGNKKLDPKLFWWLGSRITFCRGRGITKKEMYNEKGELIATMELVDFELVARKIGKPDIE